MRSIVWKEFTKLSKTTAQCNTCKKVLQIPGGTTTTLRKHSQDIHKVSIAQASKRGLIVDGPSTQTQLTNFPCFSKSLELDYVIARMCAKSGFPFSVFCTCEDIRAGLIARGFKNIPKSPSTIKALVMGVAKSVREDMVREIGVYKRSNMISITMDEWTSNANRRYANINVHVGEKIFNLGLVRCYGKMPAEKCADLLENTLMKHGISIPDVISLTTDGASVMKKMGEYFKIYIYMFY